ncbi:SHOCT domain-containing protein, partial [Paenibacillus sp. GYB003]|uniref:SHOCT domain-containing protein n=1 Tax=Paenibacillus sp. GYB003 TaxID=2994392 RepID=UPI002F96B120
ELAQAIKGGKTIAAIAAEKNVSVDSVVGLLVKAPLEKLDKQLAEGKLTQVQYDKAKAALTERATKFVNGESGGKAGLPFGKLDFKDRDGAHFEFRLAVTGELAALLGTTKDELAQAIKGGKTIAAIAAEKNVSVDSVVGLLVKAPLEKLDKQLADGKLTQEQYDKAKAALTERATKFVNGEIGGKAGLPLERKGAAFKGGFPRGKAAPGTDGPAANEAGQGSKADVRGFQKAGSAGKPVSI